MKIFIKRNPVGNHRALFRDGENGGEMKETRVLSL